MRSVAKRLEGFNVEFYGVIQMKREGLTWWCGIKGSETYSVGWTGDEIPGLVELGSLREVVV